MIGENLPDVLRGASRVAVMGIGSELHSDDAAGLAVIQKLRSLVPDCTGMSLFECHTAPESFTGPVKASNPSHTVIIDAADFGAAPGTIRILDPLDISSCPSGTHLLPFSTIAGYLKSETGCKVIVIGIQPGNLSFGGRISGPVRRSVDRLADSIAAAVCDSGTEGGRNARITRCKRNT